MEPALIVEILDRRGRLKERHRLAELPATIGRSYVCEVIVDDPFVSPQHLRVERDPEGQLLAIDLATTNHTQVADSGRPLTRERIDSELSLRLGETMLRLRAPNHAVGEALPLNRRNPQWIGLSSAALAPVAWLALVAVAMAGRYLKLYEELRLELLVSEFTVITGTVLAWSGLWALVNWIATHRFRFLDHAFNLCFWSFFMMLGEHFSGFLPFSLGADRGVEVAGWIAQALLLAGLLYGHLRLFSSLGNERLIYTAGGVAGTITALSVLASLASYFQEPRWDLTLRFRNELKPPIFRLVASDTVEAFFAQDRELKEKVDKLASERH